jgi:predicted transposase YbfD/YdcC
MEGADVDQISGTGRDAVDDSFQMLVSRLGALDDPRQAGKVSYPLVEMSMVAVAGVIADCDGWEDVADFGRDRLDWLRGFLPFENGVPSHDTFARVFSVVDVEQLEACVAGWVEETFTCSLHESLLPDKQTATGESTAATLRPHVSFDGKTMRGSHDRIHEGSPLHVVTAYASGPAVSLGQTAVAEKSNEITAIPHLVSVLCLTGCIVTIDAMGCQKEIARCLREARAEYVLAVKGNQPTLHAAIIAYFDAMEEHEEAGVEFQHRETLDKKRGRVERRLYWSAAAPAALTASGDWTDLCSIGMVISERTENGKTTRETRYYITSLENNVQEFSRVVRAHWSIENSLHWRLDVVFREDESRMRTGHSARVFTLFRKIALNLLNQERSTKRSVRAKRKQAARNSQYLIEVLTSV